MAEMAALSAIRSSVLETSLHFAWTAAFLAAAQVMASPLELPHLRGSARDHFRFGLDAVI
ncbi:hypothetical protein HKCCSP123_09125 [Rhodobacterales bacterium HKCCSP123]|nr:hypothetical protein [Rhodobacterales bacterium HKCCSP123]